VLVRQPSGRLSHLLLCQSLGIRKSRGRNHPRGEKDVFLSFITLPFLQTYSQYPTTAGLVITTVA
jgi:hypothetical protein